MIPYLQHLPYKEQLFRPGILSLSCGQRHGDLINMFCIIKGIDNLDLSFWIIRPKLGLITSINK